MAFIEPTRPANRQREPLLDSDEQARLRAELLALADVTLDPTERGALALLLAERARLWSIAAGADPIVRALVLLALSLDGLAPPMLRRVLWTCEEALGRWPPTSWRKTASQPAASASPVSPASSLPPSAG